MAETALSHEPDLRLRAGCPDEWALASFVEGGLPEAERHAIWQHVQTCAACEEVVGVAAHLLDGGGTLGANRPAPASESRPGAVTPMRGGRTASSKRRWRGPLIGLAATLVVATVLYRDVSAPISKPLEDDPSILDAREVLQRGGQDSRSLPSAWPDHGWSATRGSSEVFSARETAFRMGAWMVDLQAALSAGDAERARQAAANLKSSLTYMPESESALLSYEGVEEELLRSPPDTAAAAISAADAEKYLSTLLDRDAVDLGRWVEAARLAARLGDRALLAAVPASRLAAGPTAVSDPELERQLHSAARLIANGLTAEELIELRELLDRIGMQAAGS
jgi:hypothetical protein